MVRCNRRARVTVWKSASSHEPILWWYVSWDKQPPDREAKEQSRCGWLVYRRAKTGRPHPI